MTVPAVEGLLVSPYVGIAEFKVAPTWLDVDDLIPGGVQTAQDAELGNVLLRASAWADGYCGQRLGAHLATENTRARMGRYGQIILHPSNVPVRQVTALAYGASPQNMTVLADLTQVWPEDARGLVVAIVPMRGTWAASIEFGRAPAAGGEMFVQYSYVAGYASTVLATTASQGATSVTVADPTGFQPPAATLMNTTLAGSTARIWDPGLEEAVTVGTGYTAGNAVIPLAGVLANAHAAGVAVSEFPAEVRQAVITYAVALMLRQDVTQEEPFGRTPFGPAARTTKKTGVSSGLVENAQEMLDRYKRVR